MSEIKVYHGSSSAYLLPIYAPSIYRHQNRGKTLDEAKIHVEELLGNIINPTSAFLLQETLDLAQTTSVFSPFISTSENRAVARSFACTKSGQGYIYTIIGPRKCFFDFNECREKNGLPPHATFSWMKELGIPIELTQPFEIIKIERIDHIQEEATLIFEK
jgi:hypothetical protein